MEARFKVGDVVRIRNWEDMAKDDGVTLKVEEKEENIIINKDGDIWFNYSMRPLCGEIVVVTSCRPRNTRIEYEIKSENEAINSIIYKWNFSQSMLEEIPAEMNISESEVLELFI